MVTLDVGRVCIKIAGREAGKYCVIVNKVDDNFVTITGPRDLTGVKRRRCNIDHLEPTSEVLKIDADAGEKDVITAYGKAGLTKKFGFRKPSPEIVKETEKGVKKEVKKKPEKKEGTSIKIKIPKFGFKKVEKKPKKEEKKKPEKKKVEKKPVKKKKTKKK